MGNRMQKSLDEQNYWQLLEMVASPDADVDTDLLAECLFDIAQGNADAKISATERLVSHMREFLPDFANNEASNN